MAENGFRQLTNSVRPVTSVDDMKNLKIRVAGSNLLMECYKRWGADATNMNWSETYTALQQNTVEGQENPLPAIDAASVQEVQKYCSMWNANYDCLFFCINQDIYDALTLSLIHIFLHHTYFQLFLSLIPWQPHFPRNYFFS